MSQKNTMQLYSHRNSRTFFQGKVQMWPPDPRMWVSPCWGGNCKLIGRVHTFNYRRARQTHIMSWTWTKSLIHVDVDWFFNQFIATKLPQFSLDTSSFAQTQQTWPFNQHTHTDLDVLPLSPKWFDSSRETVNRQFFNNSDFLCIVTLSSLGLQNLGPTPQQRWTLWT